MNAKHFFLALCVSQIIFMGCNSVQVSNYEAPDYTKSEIRALEIKKISDTITEKPIESLWKAWLLTNSKNENGSDDEKVNNLFNECVTNCLTLYTEATTSDDLVAANRYFTTLKVLAPETLQKMGATKKSDDEIIMANSQFGTFSKNISKDGIASTTTNGDVAKFITGTVTVWIDLGVKVEKGLGYANRVIGSGFFIRKDGYIVTNYHVIADTVDPKYEGYSRIFIKLSSDSETRIPARVVGYDKSLDLALLKTEVDAPYVFTLGSSMNLEVGDTIYAIGSPVGLTSTITSGIVSSFDRQLLTTAAVMQIDAAINSGNSGGPLINKNGEVQGIVFAGITDYQGLNFAIPIEYLKAILNRLYLGDGQNTKTIPHQIESSWIGAYGITNKLQGDKKGNGVQVLYTLPGSSCDLSGIKSGDIITAVNSTPISSIEELQTELVALPPDMIIEFTISEGNTNTKKVPVYLSVRPEIPGMEMRERDSDWNLMYPLLGMKLERASATTKNKFIVTSIVKGSIADESGFSEHDSVTIENVVASEDNSYLIMQLFSKKRKYGYLDVSLSIGAPMDSSLFF